MSQQIEEEIKGPQNFKSMTITCIAQKVLLDKSLESKVQCLPKNQNRYREIWSLTQYKRLVDSSAPIPSIIRKVYSFKMTFIWIRKIGWPISDIYVRMPKLLVNMYIYINKY